LRQNDLCLVTSNAKTFNPPGSIYYTEAERIEKWGLAQISKASSTVIEYETDWNIDIQNEDATPTYMSDDETNTELPSAVDRELRDNSPSAMSSTQTVSGRRPLRATNTKKKEESKLLESIDADGHLPGAKDGVGAFPLTSPWADIMVALKIKGKIPHISMVQIVNNS
jgi:bromodomain-containing protein 7